MRSRSKILIEVKGKCTIAIGSCVGTKLILDVLFVPKIDKNLLSVWQLVEKGFKVMSEEGMCLIIDSCGNVLFRIKMQKNLIESTRGGASGIQVSS
ncbi:kinesin-like protein KIN-7K, chloroplastic [Gossypium australe]|uniref:Kinesin-like protein KIN-7K, chloroplastic n=1 Tax=Gossypium australe TaxID=47621 RepID=A0A5B6VQ07_9ROSI|nr:kinesin-like protein KIN-7K, chloroplastic [Gossypium australe]